MPAYEQWDIVSSVGRTALGVAAARALETRGGGLVDDPFAEQLVRAAQPDGEFAAVIDGMADDQDAQQLWPALSAHVGTRSRFFDDFFEQAAAGGVRQVVLLASGLDARPCRLNWSAGTRVFEIDQLALQRADYSTASRDGPFFECLSRRFGIDLGQLVYPGDRTRTLEELTQRGWRVEQDRDGAELGEQYGRRACGPGEEFVNRVHFVVARFDGFARSAG